MKRPRKVMGTLRTNAGEEIRITDPRIAGALMEIDSLRQALHSANNTMTRQRDQLAERNLSLARLQNHWWTRLGNLLRIVREDHHVRSTEARGRAPAHPTPADTEAGGGSTQHRGDGQGGGA